MTEDTFRTRTGVALNVAAGPRAGPPVVLLHGVTRYWQDWSLCLPYLSARWQVFALDFRGHGRSARAPGAYRVADYVPDIVDFLKRGLSEPAYLIGHSLGGNVALATAAQAPECVRALVLEDPPLEMAGRRSGETWLVDLFQIFIPHAGSNRPVSAIATDLANARVPLPGKSGWVRMGDVRDAVSLRVSAAGLKQLDPQVLEPPLAGRWLDGSDVLGDLRCVRCPTLLLQADFAAGGLLPDDYAAEMSALVGDCIRIKLPGIGHNIHSMATEAMMRLVVPFLG